MTPHFVWSATTTSRRAGLDERPVRLGLEQVRAGEAGVRVHAVDPDEDEVDVDGPQGGDGERPDERLRRRAHATGQDDRLVRPAAVVEDVGDADRVGHDGERGMSTSRRARA